MKIVFALLALAVIHQSASGIIFSDEFQSRYVKPKAINDLYNAIPNQVNSEPVQAIPHLSDVWINGIEQIINEIEQGIANGKALITSLRNKLGASNITAGILEGAIDQVLNEIEQGLDSARQLLDSIRNRGDTQPITTELVHEIRAVIHVIRKVENLARIAIIVHNIATDIYNNRPEPVVLRLSSDLDTAIIAIRGQVQDIINNVKELVNVIRDGIDNLHPTEIEQFNIVSDVANLLGDGATAVGNFISSIV